MASALAGSKRLASRFEHVDRGGEPGGRAPRRMPRHHGRMRRVVVLGRGAAGKSTLARQLGDLTGLPVTELDTLFWQPDLTPAEPSAWAARLRELCSQDAWIIDGDLGPYDRDHLATRLSAADTIIVLDMALPRVAWRALRRGRERADYWRWVWSYRRRHLPRIRTAIAENAPRAELLVLRSPRMVRRFLGGLRHCAEPGGQP